MDLLAACTDRVEYLWTWQGVALVSVVWICGTVAYVVHRYTATRYEPEPLRGPGRST